MQPASIADAADGVILSAANQPASTDDLKARFGGRVAIVIPAYDEAENLAELLPRMPARIGDVPTAVLVVDDGSRDDTAGAAMRSGACVARLPENCGGGEALRAGYSLMVLARARVVVTMDADGQHRPDDLARVVGPVLSGRAQLVQGSRVIGSAEPGPLARTLGISLFNRLVRSLTGAHVTDCSNSFRAIRTDLLPELDLRQRQFHAAEFLIEAVTRGYSLREVPVSVLRRGHGVSKKPTTLRYGFGFSRAIMTAWSRSLIRDATARAGRHRLRGAPARTGRLRSRSQRRDPAP